MFVAASPAIAVPGYTRQAGTRPRQSHPQCNCGQRLHTQHAPPLAASTLMALGRTETTKARHAEARWAAAADWMRTATTGRRLGLSTSTASPRCCRPTMLRRGAQASRPGEPYPRRGFAHHHIQMGTQTVRKYRVWEWEEHGRVSVGQGNDR